MTFLFPDTSKPGWIASVFMDSEWAQDAIEFDGPTIGNVWGVPYVTLTHGGEKEQGQETPGPMIWNAGEAWHLYLQHLVLVIADAKQIAWRARPKLEQTQRGNWTVYSRLAVFKGDAS